MKAAMRSVDRVIGNLNKVFAKKSRKPKPAQKPDAAKQAKTEIEAALNQREPGKPGVMY